MRSFWEGYPGIEGYLAGVRELIVQRASTDEEEVRAAIALMMESSGKMLRPAFVELASRFGQPDAERVRRVGASIEMLHMATLVHDDIIDGAAFRRGVPTLQARRGARTAVLVGDWLFAACFSLIADLAGSESARSLASIVARICGSELTQSAERFIGHTSVRKYKRRIAGKTAALFALSFHVGAVDAQAETAVVERLRRIGYCLGMGFQVMDDILDFAAVGRETGKPTGSDLSQGIYTLPTILALAADDGGLARRLASRPRSRRGVASAAAMIQARGGMDGARRVAATYAQRALDGINGLPPVEATVILRDISRKLLERTY